jgi:hypothetical protein
LDYKTNTETAKEPNITPVLDKIQEYRRNWLQNINRMPHNRLVRILKTINFLKKPGETQRLLDMRDQVSKSGPNPFS